MEHQKRGEKREWVILSLKSGKKTANMPVIGTNAHKRLENKEIFLNNPWIQESFPRPTWGKVSLLRMTFKSITLSLGCFAFIILKMKTQTICFIA